LFCCCYILDNAPLKIINFVYVVGLGVAKYERAKICLFLGVLLQSEVNRNWKRSRRFAARIFSNLASFRFMNIIELRFVMFVHQPMITLWRDKPESTLIASW